MESFRGRLCFFVYTLASSTVPSSNNRTTKSRGSDTAACVTGSCPRLADLGAYKCLFLAEVPKNTTTHSWITAGRLKTLRLLLVYWSLQRATHTPTRIHMHMAIV